MKRGGYLKRKTELKQTGGLKRKPMKRKPRRADHVGQKPTSGAGWRLDKLGRWRSAVWLQWIREQTPPLDAFGAGPVVAAHFRYPGCGAGTKPDDCLTYPLRDSTHKRYHEIGQPPLDEQWRWTWHLWIRATRIGLLKITRPDVMGWIYRYERIDGASMIREALDHWRADFISGALALGRTEPEIEF